MIDRNILEIIKLDDLKVIGSRLDEHTKVDVYIKKGEEFESIDHFKAVYNIQKEKVCSVPTNNFQVIQHRNIFETAVEALSNLNLEVEGRMDDFGDLVRADLTFKDQELVDDGEEGIKLGIRISNSNNKRSSFKLEMYAFRMICQNGMTIGNIIPEVREIQMHYGKTAIPLDLIRRKTEIFIKKVINSSDKLKNLVSITMEDSIEWNIVEKIMKKIIKQKKHLLEIARRLGVTIIEVEIPDPKNKDKKKKEIKYEYDGKINRWDLYNALTNYISHDEQLKPTAQTALEEASRKVLKNNFERLQTIIV